MIKSRLLSVAHTSAEISAGIPGRCAVSVRVLDNVTLRIHAGELVLVHAPESLAQAMLLAALCATGTSTIQNVGQIERGYERIDERLNALGARITRIAD
jgi:alpha-D-ribose 1-methylphosphonate 5-triphosphate synthase subunit PhnL